jgi:hypothetical protein
MPTKTRTWSYTRMRASLSRSGGGGIRTHGWLAPSTVFKTVPIDHSGTPPSSGIWDRASGIGLELIVIPESRSQPPDPLLLANLIEDVVGHVDRDVHGDREGDRVAGPGIDLDDLAFVADAELGEVGVVA